MHRIQVWLGTNGGRSAGLVLAIALLGFSIVFGWLAMLEPHAGGPGILGLELSGSSRVAGRWVPVYGRDEIYRALGFDVLFILCWSPLLALLALWTGQNYRTVSARRLGVPLATVALGAGALDLLEDLFILLGTGPGGLDPWWTAWQLAAVAAWAKWLAALLVVLYAAGGLLSLLLGRPVRAVLQGAEAVRDGDDLRPTVEEIQPHWTTGRSRLGLAFSGGGIRAASISLGALQSLERGASLGWAAADHVTSVSGGSYMTGAWSVARTDPAPLSEPHEPLPWARGEALHGPEERHLRDNLGYLLSNSPRGSAEDSIDQTTGRPSEATRARRLPAVVATVVTGMFLNAAVFLLIMWVLAQLTGWFYRWYFGLTCRSWRLDRPLAFDPDHGCLVAPARAGWPVVAWLLLGVVAVLAWVGLAKATNAASRRIPPAWLLVPKFLGYGGLAIGGALALVLVALPALISLLWRPIAGHDLFTTHRHRGRHDRLPVRGAPDPAQAAGPVRTGPGRARLRAPCCCSCCAAGRSARWSWHRRTGTGCGCWSPRSRSWRCTCPGRWSSGRWPASTGAGCGRRSRRTATRPGCASARTPTATWPSRRTARSPPWPTSVRVIRRPDAARRCRSAPPPP